MAGTYSNHRKTVYTGGAIEIAHILGKEETLRRIDKGIEKLEAYCKEAQ